MTPSASSSTGPRAASMTVPELKSLEPGPGPRDEVGLRGRGGLTARSIYTVPTGSRAIRLFLPRPPSDGQSRAGATTRPTPTTRNWCGDRSDELGLGYFGYTYFNAQKDRLRGVAINDLDDEIGPGPIEPTAMNVRRGVYSPLSRTLFLYVKASALDRAEVRKFVEFYVRLSPELAERAGGVRLNAGESDLALARLTKRTLGTMFLPSSDPRWTLQEMLEARK